VIRRYTGLMIIALVVLTIAQGVAVAEKPFPVELAVPTLETSLQQLSQLAQESLPKAQELSIGLGIAQGQGCVRVIVETSDSLSDDEIVAVGGEVAGRAPELSLLQVDIPASSLVKLAGLPGVRFVRRPYRPIPSVVSEGVTVTGADAWNAVGIHGEGIKVAIIDGGFGGLSRMIAAGTLANVVYVRDFIGDGLETGGVHGTACAEIVHEMAPDAQLVLLKIGTEVDLSNAVDDAIAQGANVISHSMGWFNTNFYDGTGPIVQIVDRAVANGILWVNAAGNSADGGHWEGNWLDADRDGWMDFHGGDEDDSFTLDAGETISILLTWNAWPATDQDYDLYLVNDAGNEVASSTNYQTGTQSPTEWISYTAHVAGIYGIEIYAHDAPTHPQLELFAIPYSLAMEYPVAVSSIAAPSNAPSVFTVGAMDWRDWDTGPQESFSSQGPTNSSRYAASITKPDICGPDGTSNSTYNREFYGTSTSAPHVAGAAALVWSRHRDWTGYDVRYFLESNAIDMGPVGKDNLYGYGRINLPQVSNYPVGYHTYGALGGWYMVSIPVESDGAASLFGTTAYRWNPTTGAYEASTVEPSKGYWVYLPASYMVTVSGDQLTSDLTLDVSTTGWYQISAPWSYPKSAIQVIKGSETKSWNDAVTAGWVRDDIYSYTAVDGDYTTPSTLNPWYGYWMKAEVDGLSLKLAYAFGTPVSTEGTPIAAPKAIVPVDLPPMPPSAPTTAMLGLTFSNSPNPVTDVHTTYFSVKGATTWMVEAVKVEIYDLSGALVYKSGEVTGVSLEWHTENDYGEYLANGVYQYKMYAKVQGQWVVSEVKAVMILR